MDTDPAASAVLIRLARELPPERKLEIALSMSQTILDAARAGVRLRHPGASELEARIELARVVLPAALLPAVVAAVAQPGEP